MMVSHHSLVLRILRADLTFFACYMYACVSILYSFFRAESSVPSCGVGMGPYLLLQAQPGAPVTVLGGASPIWADALCGMTR